jgi:hypothetical protein
MNEIRYLSVRQPWASLIASGRKTIELRTWDTRYRGDLIIVSGRKLDDGTEWPDGPRGCTLCLVRLANVRRAKRADSAAACCDVGGDDYAWELVDARPIEHVEMRGKLGLWRAISAR